MVQFSCILWACFGWWWSHWSQGRVVTLPQAKLLYLQLVSWALFQLSSCCIFTLIHAGSSSLGRGFGYGSHHQSPLLGTVLPPLLHFFFPPWPSPNPVLGCIFSRIHQCLGEGSGLSSVMPATNNVTKCFKKHKVLFAIAKAGRTYIFPVLHL